MDDLLKKFLEFEKEEKLFELKYKDIPYWQALRQHVYVWIFEKETSLHWTDMYSAKSWVVLRKRVTVLLKNLFHDIINYHRIKPGDLLYMDRINERKVDDKILDPYFDFWEFGEICAVRRCTINRYSGKYPCAEVGTSVPDAISALGHIWNKATYKIRWKYANGEIKKLDEISEKINKKFGIVISGERLFENVLENVKYHRVYGKYYNKLLNKVHPKAIMLLCAYDELFYPLCATAKKNHIPVIELQHGLITEHRSYYYGDTSSVGKELPDYLFTYGEFWNKNINMPDCVKVIAVGNPFLENRKDRFNEKCPDDKKIVFYSEPAVGKALQKIILDFLEQNKEYMVYFKMHPMEMDTAWEKKYNLLLNHPNVEMVTGDREIYELLAMARHHVVVQSTVIYEALAFNVKRYVFHLNDRLMPFIQPLIDSGCACIFESVEEFEHLLKNYPDSAGTLEISQLWRPNAKDEGQKTLRKIMYDN